MSFVRCLLHCILRQGFGFIWTVPVPLGWEASESFLENLLISATPSLGLQVCAAIYPDFNVDSGH